MVSPPAPSIHHDFESPKDADSDDTVVDGPKWNADHVADDGAIPTDALALGTTTALVGGAGAAAALPATPEGYITVGDFVVPYYAKHVAAPTLRSVGTPYGGSSALSHHVAKPAGLAAGDLIVIPFTHRFGPLGLPDGFTDGLGQQTSGNWDIDVLWKIADSSDVAASDWNFTGPAYNGIELLAVALAFETAGEPLAEHAYASALSGLSGWDTAAIPVAVGSVLNPATGLVAAPAWANYPDIVWGDPVADIADPGDGVSVDLCVYVGSPIAASGASGAISNPQAAWAMALAVPYSG